MGVSGSGKTSLGKRLALRLGLPFYDADDFHSEENKAKMKSGEPLTDEDRWPWLNGLAEHLRQWELEGGAVLACSALKESYRERLTQQCEVHWIVLTGSFETMYHRMQRRNHFMPPTLLQSQFDTLELPDYGIEIDCSIPIETAIDTIMTKLEENE